MAKKKIVPESMITFMKSVVAHLPLNARKRKKKADLIALSWEVENDTFQVSLFLSSFPFYASSVHPSI